eukprot:3774172-Rhodomonas_salina.1
MAVTGTHLRYCRIALSPCVQTSDGGKSIRASSSCTAHAPITTRPADTHAHAKNCPDGASDTTSTSTTDS